MDNPNPTDSPEGQLWLRGWKLGYDEKTELDVDEDVDGIGSLFEPRD